MSGNDDRIDYYRSERMDAVESGIVDGFLIVAITVVFVIAVALLTTLI